MPGPRKPDYSDRIIDFTKSNFEFLKELWGEGGAALRNEFLTSRDEPALRRLLLQKAKIEIEATVRLVVVDILTTKTNSFVTDPDTQDFYVLVLPPKPRRNPGDARYEELQGWTAAHYHAINDSYGM
jgi:hypothetical protein